MGNDKIINGKNSRTFKERKEMVNVEKEERKLTYGIRGKLISAVAMLLVAMIMVVSSTYAWFTLSTAPEVKGISTAVGANGALEMQLATKDASGNWLYKDYNGDPIPNTHERNNYWGNLVDLNDDHYGSDKITLYPSNLNIDDASGKLILGSPLKTPKYGEDGRVKALENGGSFGLWNGTAFAPQENGFGFRALGVASGLTERQQAFRAAKSSIPVAREAALADARLSLTALSTKQGKDGLLNNGTVLAGIAIRRGMQGDSATYTAEDVASITSMVTHLKNALADIEEAYLQSVYTAMYSKLIDQEDSAAVNAVETLQNTAETAEAGLGKKIAAVLAKLTDLGDTNGTVAGLLYGYDKFTASVTAIATAEAALDAIGTDYTWAKISAALHPLVDTSLVTVNDYTVNEIKSDDAVKSDLFSQATKGLTVRMPTGSGVYANISDICGAYRASIKINSAELNAGFDGLEVDATMETKIVVPDPDNDNMANAPFLNTIYNGMSDAIAPDGAQAGTLPLTEFYGYVIDLVFRTNAAQSSLLLQAEAVDRIYDDNGADSQTMGSGSTMTFKTDDPGFSTDKVKALMSNIRIVFFDTKATDMAEIFAYAKLDVTDTTIGDDGVTAKMVLCEADGTAREEDDQDITSLNQNAEKHISALVYLDGDNLGNDDVVATAAKSIYGTANFQFSSSAALEPMDYADLHNPNPTPAP